MQSGVRFNRYFPTGFLNRDGVRTISGNLKPLLLLKLTILLNVSQGFEGGLVQLFKKHGPAHLTS